MNVIERKSIPEPNSENDMSKKDPKPTEKPAKRKARSSFTLRQFSVLRTALRDVIDSAEDGTRFHYFVSRESIFAARAAIKKGQKA